MNARPTQRPAFANSGHIRLQLLNLFIYREGLAIRLATAFRKAQGEQIRLNLLTVFIRETTCSYENAKMQSINGEYR